MYDNPDIYDDFPTIFILVFFVNWFAWYRILEQFWLSLLIASIIYFLGYIIYIIAKYIYR